MKKIIAVFLAILVFVCTFISITVASASSDFVIKDGVLTSYKGTSSDVIIPSSVYKIAPKAFEGNTSIQSVTFSDNLYSIGDKAFYTCTSLKTVKGGKNVSYSGAYAFASTKFLNSSTVEFLTIGSCLLWYNGTSANVVLPDNITSVSPYAFLRCNTMKSFKGSSVISIGEAAFYECTALASVSVPNSVSYIGAYAFEGTPYLNNSGEFPTLGDGILLKYNGSSSEVTIPKSVRQISSRSFYGNKNIASVDIPQSVFSIGKQAFAECSALSNIKLSNGLVMIDEEAFANCKNLTSVSTPETLSNIAKGAFINCSSLENISLKGNSLYVSYGAFAYCNKLNYILFSTGVEKLDDMSFSNCSSLKSIGISAKTTDISKTAFNSCPKFTVYSSEKSAAKSVLSDNVFINTVKGDCDLDNKLTISDATRLQHYLSSLEKFNACQICAADINNDAKVDISDATIIQSILSKLVDISDFE